MASLPALEVLGGVRQGRCTIGPFSFAFIMQPSRRAFLMAGRPRPFRADKAGFDRYPCASMIEVGERIVGKPIIGGRADREVPAGEARCRKLIACALRDRPRYIDAVNMLAGIRVVAEDARHPGRQNLAARILQVPWKGGP